MTLQHFSFTFTRIVFLLYDFFPEAVQADAIDGYMHIVQFLT